MHQTLGLGSEEPAQWSQLMNQELRLFVTRTQVPSVDAQVTDQ
jgi:hypothetical protein